MLIVAFCSCMVHAQTLHRYVVEVETVPDKREYKAEKLVNGNVRLEPQGPRKTVKYYEILSGTFQGPLIKQIAQPVRDAYRKCSDTAFAKIYCAKDVLDIELAGYQVITTLVDLMIEAVRYPHKAYSQLLINRVSHQYDMQAPTLYGKIQAVLDYISGMTDVYALDLYRKINGNSLPAV